MSAISPLLSESKCSGRVYQVNISLEALILRKLNVKKTRHAWHCMLPVRLGASLKVIQVIHVFCWSIFIFETNEEDFLNLDAEPPAQQKSVYVTHNKLRTVNLTRIHDMFVHVLYTCSDVLHLAVWHSRVRDVAKHQSVGRTSPLWWACTSLIHFQWNDHFKLCVICMSLALIIHHPSAFQENPCWEQSTKSSSRYSSWSHCVQGGQNQNWYCEAEARVNYIGKHAKRLTIDENITHIISYQSKFQAASSCRVPKSCAAHPSQGQAADAPVQAAPRAAPLTLQTFEASYPLTFADLRSFLWFFHGNLHDCLWQAKFEVVAALQRHRGFLLWPH